MSMNTQTEIDTLKRMLADAHQHIELRDQRLQDWADRYDKLLDEHVALLKQVGKLPADFEFKD